MISVDQSSPTLAFEQIRSQLFDLIRSGRLEAAHRLPSIRQLAGDLAVSPGTVARAYGELIEAGLIASSRSGARVMPGQAIDEDIHRAARRFTGIAQQSSLSLEDAIGMIRAAWAG